MRRLQELLNKRHDNEVMNPGEVDEIINLLISEDRTIPVRDEMIATDMVKRLNELCKCFNTENAHILADEILCDMLDAMDYEDIVKAYKAVPKWYA